MPDLHEPAAATATGKRRSTIGRNVVWLAVATLALVVFILALGDIRRKDTPLSQAKWYAARLTEKAGNTSALPLNFDVPVTPAHEPKVKRFKRLDPDEARLLRGTDKRVIAAYTSPIKRMLNTDGRVVIFFETGSFSSQWLALEEFDALLAAQKELIRQLHGTGIDE